ncbi:MAG: Cdc6-like AAA superfamily ATPase [Polaribacter sp.]|jgi:Cdc6-like AAA superfamily ATPase
MAHKEIILKLLKLAQELDKTDKRIECIMIVNDMEKLLDNYVVEQLNLHNVVRQKNS